MADQGFDLADVFSLALNGMKAERQQVNDLDGYNGNHGDNMVANLEMITKALREHSEGSPTEALTSAAEQVRSEGRGGTSQFYAQGLSQAAEQLQGHVTLDQGDILTLVQTLMGAIPSQGYTDAPGTAETVLAQVLGQSHPAQAPAQTEPEAETSPGLGSIFKKLLPFGLAFLRAKQSGADTTEAVGQSLLQAALGLPTAGQLETTPRTAAGGVIVRSILGSLVNR